MDIFHTRLPDKAPKFRALSSPVLQSCIAAPQSQPRRFGRLMWVRRRVACPAALRSTACPRGDAPFAAVGSLQLAGFGFQLQSSALSFPPRIFLLWCCPLSSWQPEGKRLPGLSPAFSPCTALPARSRSSCSSSSCQHLRERQKSLDSGVYQSRLRSQGQTGKSLLWRDGAKRSRLL